MPVTKKPAAPPENTREPNGEKKGSAWTRWYAKNKAQVSASRKERYANDPEYRERVKEAARVQKITLLDWDDVASRCGVKLAELHSQCDAGLFPAPGVYEKLEVFTMGQFELIRRLQTIIKHHGKHSQDVGDHVSLTYANWQ